MLKTLYTPDFDFLFCVIKFTDIYSEFVNFLIHEHPKISTGILKLVKAICFSLSLSLSLSLIWVA